MSDTKEIGWAILELMGHRKLAGYVREVDVAGAGMLRIDVPADGMSLESVCNAQCGAGPIRPDGPWQATQYYSPSAIYCLTPTRPDEAIRFARSCRPAPVSRWELAELPPAKDDPLPAVSAGGDDDEWDEDAEKPAF